METEEGRKTGDKELSRAGEQKDRKGGQSKRKLKVGMRTVWSSELDRDTAAVTSVLISPRLADEMSVGCVCGKPLPLAFWLQIAWAGGEE